MIQEEMEAMRDDMEGAMRCLHVDLLRQLQQQEQEHSRVVSQLEEDNARLREEIEMFRQG